MGILYESDIGPVIPAALRVPRRPAPLRRGWVLVLAVAGSIALTAVAWLLLTGFAAHPFPQAISGRMHRWGGEAPALPAGMTRERQIAQLTAERRRLEAALARKIPRGHYIVIDQTHNRLHLMRQNERLMEAVCSAGSGMVLLEGSGRKRTWVFDTPRGVHTVLRRVEKPVWKKPDWAFVEEGLPLPRRDDERIEYGVLGEYAFHFGNGYMIHGTLYERLLGRSVTHGCIRLGRENLRRLWKDCPVGTPIYVY
ncbi:MAG: L,D-transpeptidase family protein [Candidatus Eisenbacteria bacterium]|uniref:L,D-transpeptidase family protein n=1 Tax=Eiseniibacteriota bacterium TaxID=2212470 RepID=A0A938BS06_UNCEI|nr:L,D-transpeptidase family protein [Candidatus Eisenbacteria bacterium]